MVYGRCCLLLLPWLITWSDSILLPQWTRLMHTENQIPFTSIDFLYFFLLTILKRIFIFHFAWLNFFLRVCRWLIADLLAHTDILTNFDHQTEFPFFSPVPFLLVIAQTSDFDQFHFMQMPCNNASLHHILTYVTLQNTLPSSTFPIKIDPNPLMKTF